MAVEWSPAPQVVIETARRIIARYHGHLLDARIAFIFRSEAPVAGGMVTHGRCKKVSAELQVHVDYDFIIWLAQDSWRRFSALQREALIDHELSHREWDGDVASIKGHDIEEFAHIIERYGFWLPSSDRVEMAVQARLPLPKAESEPARVGGVGTIDFGRVAKEAEAALGGE